ncbi:MAG TPA: amidohydrolase family protein [Anaerolineales bacterium]|nr:amidohydrolase family protein [Anaerolineales bacterium]
MSIRKHCLLVLFALLLLSCAAPTARQDTLALINGTLIDGTSSVPISNAVILIQGERIIGVGPKEAIKIPRGARVLDLEGATVLPGFINAHVHFAYNEQNLQAWAYGGVTTVRDESIVSSNTLEELMALRDAAKQDPQVARLISAGYMLTVPDGYGELFVTSPEDAQRQVFKELDAGVDLIKISMEDGYAGRHDLPKLTDEEIAAIISAAHQRGTLVSGHITQAAYLKILVEAGVDDIAHVPYDMVPTEVWRAMVAKGIYMTPTFTVFRNYAAPIATCVRNLHNFLAQGGQVALGNDYGGGPGEFELGIPMYEIEQMSAAGMTPLQIIVASTKNAAHVSGIEDQVGTLEAGKFADVLVVSGNPLDDLQNLRHVRMVIHHGTIIRDESLNYSD